MTLAEERQSPRPKRHLFGRRVGRGLSGHLAGLIQTDLPSFRLNLDEPPPWPPTRLFDAAVDDVWLEIGFGGGEHLLWQAKANPHVGFIGCEPFVTGVAKVVRRLAETESKTVRLYDDDARHVLDWLPQEAIGRVFILFPDPWPKKRHRKRRFLSGAGLGRIARVMRRGAELRFATDIADYAEMVVKAAAAGSDFRPAPGELGERPLDWPLTRYAEKAVAAGRICRYFVFEKM